MLQLCRACASATVMFMFSDTTWLAPTTTTVFRLSLAREGVHVGWLGECSTEWAIVVHDIRQALLLEPCPYNGCVYYRVMQQGLGLGGPARYMAVSADACIGFYNWANASGFTRQGAHLVADDTRQKLALQSAASGCLCAWDGCSVLDVGFEPAGSVVVSARARLRTAR
jgi:hypothetical protein